MAGPISIELFHARKDDGQDGFVLTSVTELVDGSSETIPANFSKKLEARDVKEGLAKNGSTEPTSRSPSNSTKAPPSRIRSLYNILHLVVFSVYRQLWAMVVAANIAAIVTTITHTARLPTLPLAGCVNAAVANLLVAILVREDYIRIIMYHTCWSVPHSAPLWLRKRLAKVYENGGVHSGAAVSAVLWFAVLTGFLWTDLARDAFSDAAVLLCDCVLAVLLVVIVIMAVPQMRRRYHDTFEHSHRWAGWFGIAFFWIALILFTRDTAHDVVPAYPLGGTLVKLPAFWMLTVISLHVIYPWVFLRKVAVVRADRLTDRAIRLYFSPKEKVPPLHGLAISTSPFGDWHAFAAIPEIDGSDAGATSCIIANAGDWTARAIESPAPFYYMRGMHVPGALHMAKVFRSVILMATGSGIGPCLSVFGNLPRTQVRIIWLAPDPRVIFGDRIYDAVVRQDPHALIWDTRRDGRRPDLVQMAEAMYHAVSAEAVFFISNRTLTRRVIHDLEERNVAAFAPVFDS